MTRLIPISFKRSTERPRDVKGRFCSTPENAVFNQAQELLRHTRLYRATPFFNGVLAVSRYTRVYADRVGKKFLDRISCDTPISGEGLPETLDDLSRAWGVEIGLLELRHPIPMERDKTDFELVVVGARKNLLQLSAIRENLRELGFK